MMILVPMLLPLLGAFVMLAIKPLHKNDRARNLYVAAVTFAACAFTVYLCVCGSWQFTAFTLMKGITVAFRLDGIGKLFAIVTVAMWSVSSIFSSEYLKHETNVVRYHFFFLASLTALLGITFSENLITMYLFYEMMTLMTFPLVIHSMSKESIQAALKYLFYSMGGAFLALFGFFYLTRVVDSFTFTAGGTVNTALMMEHQGMFLFVVFLMILGFGSKAGLFPLHGWLPAAHPVAPAPASALLSGNVTKMGVFAIIRVLFYIVGADNIRGTWVQYAFLGVALLTVVMGSMLAYREKVLKKRLAYSTVSQVSYILFGIALLNQTAFLGAMMHVVFHSVVKNALFLSAGAIIYKTHRTKVSELTGIGKEMPVVMWCYTIASITLVGIPPTSAFLSKWYLAEGALNSGTGIIRYLGPVLLLVSALLTAGYLLSITIQAFFPGTEYDYSALTKKEPNWLMTVPLVALATAAVVFGMFPNGLINVITAMSNALM